MKAPEKSPALLLPPSPTLYIRNLNERIKPLELKTSLYQLSSAYGEVIDIVICKDRNVTRMRGQAFVVFRTEQMAVHAKANLHNFAFFGRPLDVNFAKEKSKASCEVDWEPKRTLKKEAKEEQK